MQWDPETMDWALGPPFISPLAGRAWPWLLSIPAPMGPRLGPAEELCGGGWPTSWLTEGSLFPAACTLLMGERTGP